MYLKNNNTAELKLLLNDWNRAQAIDTVLDDKTPKEEIRFDISNLSSEILMNKKTIYLDFNIYQVYEENVTFRRKLDEYGKKESVHFVYSPTHMEEICRMNNRENEKNRMDNISKISEGWEILPIGNALSIVHEPVIVCMERARSYQVLNEDAEVLECASFDTLEEQSYKLLSENQSDCEKIKKGINSLTAIQLFDPLNIFVDNVIINKVFENICGAEEGVEYYRNYFEQKRSYSQIRSTILLFYKLMNALGFHKNKIERRTQFTEEAAYPIYSQKFYKKIRSGFFDLDHICYASKCDYFITLDKVLASQAKKIYSYLGCKTHVIKFDKTNPFGIFTEIDNGLASDIHY